MARLLLPFVGLLISQPALAQAPTAEQKQATLAWVKSLQKENGGFATDAKSAANLPATLAAERVFKYFGGELPNKEPCAKFVESCFDKESGGFAPAPGGNPDVRTTALGIMAAVELKALTPPMAAAAVMYFPHKTKNFDDVRLVAAAYEALGPERGLLGIPYHAIGLELECDGYTPKANANGTYGEGGNLARDTAGGVVTFLRLEATKNRLTADKLEEITKLLQAARDNPKKNPLHPETKETILKTLRTGQRPDGGWGKDGEGSDLETTYRVMRAFWMLKAKPDIAACQAFIAKCRNADGSYSPQPNQAGNVSATYFAAIVSHWLAELK